MACITQSLRFLINWKFSQLQAEIEGLKGQRASQEATIADAEQLGELAIKDVQAKAPELEATLRTSSSVSTKNT